MDDLIAQQDVGQFGITPETLADADEHGTGPPVRVLIGEEVYYSRDALLFWIEKRRE